MFGIGFWEMLVIGGLILIAVGPDRLPTMIKTVAGFYRQLRRAALDIRESTGIDEMLRDQELKELADLRRQKIQLMDPAKKVPTPVAGKPGAPAGKPEAPEGTVARGPGDKPVLEKPLGKPGFDKPMAPAGKTIVPDVGTAQQPGVLRGLSLEDRHRETPLEGVDVAVLRGRLAPKVVAHG